MTKPTIELIEDYGEACYEHGRLGVTYAGEDAYDKSGELLTEIRQRIEADADRLAGLERDAARLDSGCIITSERDEFGEDYFVERCGLNLRADIDAAIAGAGRG